MGAIIKTISDEGRTVLFSSHLLHEVERVSDQVAMIDKGKIVKFGTPPQRQPPLREISAKSGYPTGAAEHRGRR